MALRREGEPDDVTKLISAAISTRLLRKGTMESLNCRNVDHVKVELRGISDTNAKASKRS